MYFDMLEDCRDTMLLRTFVGVFTVANAICFIYFLYFDLYVLGDDAWISLGVLMQTKHLCVLGHI